MVAASCCFTYFEPFVFERAVPNAATPSRPGSSAQPYEAYPQQGLSLHCLWKAFLPNWHNGFIFIYAH
ncbi:hypothetical protein HMF3257_11305 [Spirosoma telluris]|uniref:Uncharacterized protein n=1 Tax=Spirosoma telluris TaxID=2183553 RepID=A0A327NH46_9BACT|nr:hypothetical protein HMF3257_11305 [Spirosoma telluris]